MAQFFTLLITNYYTLFIIVYVIIKNGNLIWTIDNLPSLFLIEHLPYNFFYMIYYID